MKGAPGGLPLYPPPPRDFNMFLVVGYQLLCPGHAPPEYHARVIAALADGRWMCVHGVPLCFALLSLIPVDSSAVVLD